MRKWLNMYFDMSRREFNGLLVLVVFILLVSILPGLYRLVRPDLEDIPSEKWAMRKLTVARSARSNSNQLFYFDPNTVTSVQWQKLGLSEKQASSILKYRSKGGRFRSAKDLAKMYTISSEMYMRLEPYVRIVPDSEVDRSRDFSSPAYLNEELAKPVSEKAVGASPPLPIIEINQADSSMLEEIRGIGPAFSRRILKYRERLGGFYKKEQLREVYGLDSAKYEEIKEQVRINPLLIKKIDINNATFDQLKNCPYLRYKQINAIIQYRKQHGNYTSVEDIKRIAIINAETIDQLTPYLMF